MLDAKAMIAELKNGAFTKIKPEDVPAFNEMAAMAEMFARYMDDNDKKAVTLLAGLVAAFAVELHQTRINLKAAKANKN